MSEYSEPKPYLHNIENPVSAPPRRVVSLVPSITESLFDLNVGDRLIAVTDYCIHPADKVAGLARIGGTKNPDVDTIIAMQPDLVFANQEENRREDVERLQSAGIPVWVTFPKNMREAFSVLWNIMHIFDAPELVERVRSMEWTLDWLERMAQRREDDPLPTFVPIWYDPWMTFNADTYAHDVIRVCGGTNIFAERERLYPLAADLGRGAAYAGDDPRIQGRDTRYPRLTLDEIMAAQPQVILLPNEPFPFTQSHADELAALDIPAARIDPKTGKNRIHLVDGSLITWHGTRMARAMSILPPLFYPAEDFND